ncbi:MAG TPA: sialidase family protein [Frankiaceae bacterium]|nr:sialidase family protein [Frankiaceae bacterium]
MRRRRLLAATVVTAAVAAVLAAPAVAAKKPPVGFGKPVRVDKELGGSEGFVFYSARHKRLVYTAHLGTTLLLRDGLTDAPVGTAGFASTYRNQVPLWTSDDLGKTWKRVDMAGGFFANPAASNGFSDPDLTEDASGRVYGTGINLANDALFSSTDGGKTWLTGTPQCHDGDRPWLAGGAEDEVFVATNSTPQGPIVVRSTDGGLTCSTAYATRRGSGWTGYGKIFYDRRTDTLFQPAVFGNNGLGLAKLEGASKKFDSGTPGSFSAVEVVDDTSFNTFWRAVMARDSAGGIYLVWSTDKRGDGTGGCDGARTPRANEVMMVHSADGGRRWSKPQVVARTGTTLLQPWVVAGSRGNVAVGWFQYDSVVDPNCAPDKAKVNVKTAFLYGVGGRSSKKYTVDAVGAPVHLGAICDHGTTCVATGEDRRLGEFFTLALDGTGCVMVATGDTRDKDPVTGGELPTARPLFVRQARGPSLTGKTCR